MHSVTIDKYSYLNVRKLPPFFEHRHRIVYSKQENAKTVDEIIHPSVRETLKYFNIGVRVEPARFEVVARVQRNIAGVAPVGPGNIDLGAARGRRDSTRTRCGAHPVTSVANSCTTLL